MFEWKDSYSCKVRQIDEQHKQLFKLGEDLNKIISNRDGEDHYDEIMNVLKELKDYTIYHFNFEEALLQKNGYVLPPMHKEEHRAFIEKIMELETEDVDSKQRKVTMDILIFIANWIEKHIVKVDMQYSQFLNEKGIY